ncbi:hypothetical protein HAX54_047731, partial [Datura stramonium]|nr:hypothetical protein [Datura stramonium]
MTSNLPHELLADELQTLETLDQSAIAYHELTQQFYLLSMFVARHFRSSLMEDYRQWLLESIGTAKSITGR